MNTTGLAGERALLAFMTIHGAASLLHFVHNGVYLRDYPNLPEWLTAVGVYATWVGVATLGAIGYAVYRYRSPRLGLAIVAVYALLGFGGLDHYVVAPLSSHTAIMNVTIGFEVTTALALLLFVVAQFPKPAQR